MTTTKNPLIAKPFTQSEIDAAINAAIKEKDNRIKTLSTALDKAIEHIRIFDNPAAKKMADKLEAVLENNNGV